ncbi:hypothetical protein [Roseiarcus fermentans]|nr:hypothetical protein [Roseiarcus fermentans]
MDTRFASWCFACIFSVLASYRAQAQVALEVGTDIGLWRVTVAAEKTTFLGQYGTYVEPAVARAWNVFWRGPPSHGGGVPPSGGGSSGGSGGGSAGRPSKPRPDFWHILLPSGKLPRDLQLGFTGVPGGYASLMYEPDVLRLWAGLKPRISVEIMYDMNAVNGNAPTGFGILTDPTRGYASASITAFGPDIALPVWGWETGSGSYALYAGHGWMKDWTYTYGAVQSVFLQLSTKTYVHRTIQTYSLTGEWRPPRGTSSLLDIPNIARFSGVDFLLQGYGTEHMWTIGATAAAIWRL